MQTFLPSADFKQVAADLDRQRLGKQRVEAFQILRALSGATKGWTNHPAVLMWRGHENALVEYGVAMCIEWHENRGYVDNMRPRIEEFATAKTGSLPEWLGDERLHSSHRAALLFKQPEHYTSLGWTEDPAIDYFWPVRKAQ